jgi:ubiquinone/menaquinone biosynthesis C-methylase UbiE
MARYLHGTSADEQARLSRLNDLINRRALGEFGLRGGERVADFGSGLGQLTRALARAVGPGGRVVGIERSREQIDEATRQALSAGEGDLVEFRLGDVAEPPLRDDEWGTFDVAHARFVLEHVPDPLAVARQMVRAVRPGGRVILQDDDHAAMRLYPEPPGFGPLWEAYARTYDRNGNDPYIGRRLVWLLHEAGARPSRNTQLFFGSCAGDPDLDAFVENLVQIVEGVRDSILPGGLLDASSFDAAIRGLRDWAGRPGVAFWYSIPWAEAVRPE